MQKAGFVVTVSFSSNGYDFQSGHLCGGDQREAQRNSKGNPKENHGAVALFLFWGGVECEPGRTATEIRPPWGTEKQTGETKRRQPTLRRSLGNRVSHTRRFW